MKIAICIGSGANQVALANKIAERVPTAGIIIEKRPAKKKSLSDFFAKVFDRIFFFRIHNCWKKLLHSYQLKYPVLPDTSLFYVANINSVTTEDILKKLAPELLIISGTSIVKKNIIQLFPAKSIINLHTGLSPYIKGGPNCTNWNIATNELYLIGNTIMWIDEGIDSGNIISTEITLLNEKDTYEDIHYKVMEHAHDLYIKCILKIIANKNECPSIPQSTVTKGRLYFNKDWNFKMKYKVLKNINSKRLKKQLSSSTYNREKELLVTFPFIN